MDVWKHDGRVGIEEGEYTRAESSDESKFSGGKRDMWTGNNSEMETWEMGRRRHGERKAEVKSIEFYECRETDETEGEGKGKGNGEGEGNGEGNGEWNVKIWGREARGQRAVVQAEEEFVDKRSDDKIGGDSGAEGTEELDLVQLGNCGGGGGVGAGAEKRRRDMEEKLQLEELAVRRLELAVKVRELAVRRERLELECAELKVKRRRVELEMRKWSVGVGTLGDCTWHD